jgi:hypothetical protein
LTQQLTVLRETKESSELKGAAFAAAGLLKCGGMTQIVDMKILEIFATESFGSKKANLVRKQAGLNLYECLSISMGKSFEVFLPKIFSHVLDSISDSKETVRLAA